MGRPLDREHALTVGDGRHLGRDGHIDVVDGDTLLRLGEGCIGGRAGQRLADDHLVPHVAVDGPRGLVLAQEEHLVVGPLGGTYDTSLDNQVGLVALGVGVLEDVAVLVVVDIGGIGRLDGIGGQRHVEVGIGAVTGRRIPPEGERHGVERRYGAVGVGVADGEAVGLELAGQALVDPHLDARLVAHHLDVDALARGEITLVTVLRPVDHLARGGLEQRNDRGYVAADVLRIVEVVEVGIGHEVDDAGARRNLKRELTLQHGGRRLDVGPHAADEHASLAEAEGIERLDAPAVVVDAARLDDRHVGHRHGTGEGNRSVGRRCRSARRPGRVLAAGRKGGCGQKEYRCKKTFHTLFDVLHLFVGLHVAHATDGGLSL